MMLDLLLVGHDERDNAIVYIRHSDGWYNLYTETGPYSDEYMAVHFAEQMSESVRLRICGPALAQVEA
jgi:hypothetical protein